MASNNCPGCGEERTDPSAPCPRCGYRKDPDIYKKLAKFILIFVVLGILWLLFLTKDLWSK